MRLGESVWNSVDQTVLNRYSQIPVTLPVLKFRGVTGDTQYNGDSRGSLVRQRDEDSLSGWFRRQLISDLQ